MSTNQIRIDKRKKYLEPDASDQEKIIPRTSVWRGHKRALTVNQNQVLADLQEQTVVQQREEVEDTIEAREQEEFVGDPDNLSNIDEQALDNFIWGNVSDHEQSNIGFLRSEADDRVYIDNPSSLSDEGIYAEHVSHEDVENECAESNNDNTFKSNSLADNLKNFDSPIFENAPTTITETLLMVMMYAMKHSLT
ncbi:hypothetical protein AVEN_21579-1 [Araneus ventricosus]|uniref:Uncharacterized protein n=1 Tax=Araneus ventricosus TaxID=182803 RepID=A0A4Y2NUC6_ARAVE|nr:hypothetical protein AVEN_21579-1 [Araneus ventricosus]